MSFHNVPPNGFPDLPDVEELEAVEKDVVTLKSTATSQGEAITALQTAVGTKAAKADVAPTFSAEGNYAVGDLVYYEGTLYKCTTAHEAAAWDAEDFTATSIDDEVNELNSKITDLTANDFAGYDDITASTVETAYTCPCDGYLYVSSEIDTTGTIRVVVVGATSLNGLGYIYMNVTDEYQMQTLFVRKGMKVYVFSKTTNAIVRFNKFA